MSRIAVLPPEVADQIAAGEVVERPFSIVKELVENALDAGATAVEIQIVDGGRELIAVSDDGSGMTPEEAVLALRRHATSKIRSATDLTGVRTFGFRGEALPAIASVANVRVETAIADGEGIAATSVGGEPRIIGGVARRRGTTVTVSSLFHNIPARRKFLRGERSEWRAIYDMVMTAALSRLDVRISVTRDARKPLLLSATGSMRDRIAQLWGGEFAERLLDVEDVSGTIHVSGLVERPSDTGTASRRVQLLVNGRAIRDIGLVRAAEAAYRSTIVAGLRPSIFMALVVPGSEVDVNVHPAKAEVRFLDRWSVERAVEQAVRRALGTTESAATLGRSSHRFTSFRPAETDWRGRGSGNDGAPVPDIRPGTNTPAPAAREGELELDARVQGDEREHPLTIPPLTQLHRTYLMFEREDGIVLIDQHAAHERVLYEDFLRTLQSGTNAAQRLLLPLTLHLNSAEADAFEAFRTELDTLGFEVEGFGGNSLIVRSVPLPHPRFDAERCLRETLATLAGDRVASVQRSHERLAATVACKAAIKAGDQLSQSEMRALFQALADTLLPIHDVHGRSVVVHIPWDEVERRFGRR